MQDNSWVIYSGNCYKYRLSDQYIHEYTMENIRSYSQKHSRISMLHKQLEEHRNHLLKSSRVERTTVSTTEAHISSPGPHTHTPAR